MASETELSRMVVRLVGDSTQYTRMLTNVQQQTAQAGRTMKKEAENAEVFGKTIDQLGTRMSNMAGQMMAFRAIQQPFDSLKGAVKAAGDMEQLEIAFETIIGDTGRAHTAIKALVDFADKTPFEMPEVVAAAKQMLAMGTVAEDIVPTMRMLGDVSAGLGIRLGDLTYIFGTLQSQGRAFTQDINQFAMRGIPIWEELSKQFGVSKLEMRGIVEQGKVGFKDVEKAFRSMTGEGGRFANMTQRQSESFNGMLSTMMDSIAGVARTVGKNTIEMLHLKDALDSITSAFKAVDERLQQISPNVKTLITLTIALTAASLALFTVWKVGALAVGMVVGVMKDMVITLKWVVAGVWAWVVALKSQTIATTVAATGVNGMLGMVETSTKVNRSAVIAAYALRAALISLGVAGVAYLTFRLVGGTKALEDYEEALKRSTELTDKMVDSTTKRFDTSIASVKGIEDRGARKTAADDMVALIEKETAGRADQMEKIKNRIAELQELISSGSPFKIMERRREITGLKDELDQILKLYNLGKEKAAEFGRIAKDTAPETDPEITKAIKEMTEKLSLQAATWGMAAAEAEIYKIKVKGATEEQLQAIRQWNVYLAIMAAAKAASEAATKIETDRWHGLNRLIEKLAEEAITTGMSEDALLDYQLAVLGANETEIEMAKTFAKTIAARKKQNDLMEEGKKLTEEFRTPTQVYNDQVSKLTTMLMIGAIGLDTYTSAMIDAKTHLDEAGKSTEKTRQEIEKLDAVLAGSAEAKSRIAAFAERNAVPIQKPGGTVAGGAAGGISSATAMDWTKILLQIATNTGAMANKPVVELDAADIDEAA